MPVIPANNRPVYYTDCNGNRCSFRPEGKLHVHDPGGFFDIHRDNPWVLTHRRGDKKQAARFIVGFNVGDVPTWSIEDIIDVVREVRTRQISDPPASLVAQKGILRHKKTGKEVVEDGAQVIIVDIWKTPPKKWKMQMLRGGEEIAARLRQSAVFLELQENGIMVEQYLVEP